MNKLVWRCKMDHARNMWVNSSGCCHIAKGWTLRVCDAKKLFFSNLPLVHSNQFKCQSFLFYLLKGETRWRRKFAVNSGVVRIEGNFKTSLIPCLRFQPSKQQQNSCDRNSLHPWLLLPNEISFFLLIASFCIPKSYLSTNCSIPLSFFDSIIATFVQT